MKKKIIILEGRIDRSHLIAKYLKKKDFHVEQYCYEKRPYLHKKIPHSVLAIPKVLREFKEFDMIHTDSALIAGFTAYLNKRINKIPYTITLNGLFWEELPDSIRGLKMRVLQKKILSSAAKKVILNADHIFTVSKYVKKRVIKKFPEVKDRLSVIYHAPEYSRSLKKRIHKKTIILCITDFKFRKKALGAKFLIDSFEKVCKNSDSELSIAGKGHYLQKIKNYAGSKRYSKKIKFLGFIEDINKLFSRADIFAYCSFLDGLPRVLIEAQAASLPVIVKDECGCREAIVDKKSGFLVENKEEFAKKTLLLIKNKKLRKSMGKKAEKIVKEKFNTNKMGQAYYERFKKILC
jgi:glycosyltransferase involved in cell wall biosynthesis